MAVNWVTQAKKVARAFEEDGQAISVFVSNQSGIYDVTSGKRPTTAAVEYESHGFVKSIESELDNEPAQFEIIFHSGITPDTLPDLTKEKNIVVELESGEQYSLNKVKAIRPGNATMTYKGFGVLIKK